MANRACRCEPTSDAARDARPRPVAATEPSGGVSGERAPSRAARVRGIMQQRPSGRKEEAGRESPSVPAFAARRRRCPGRPDEMEGSMNRTLRRSLSVLAALIMVGVTVAGLQAATTTKVISNRSDLHFIVVTHGQPSDPFWSVVKNGVDQAGKDMGVHVQYESPTSNTLDLVAMSHLIDAAVASKPDGLVVSIPDANVLGPSIKRAVAAGIPVISINSGADVAQSLGVMVHVGQTEYEAGLGGGQRLGEAGVRNALCVNQEVGNVALDQRCKGVTDALAKFGGKVKV